MESARNNAQKAEALRNAYDRTTIEASASGRSGREWTFDESPVRKKSMRGHSEIWKEVGKSVEDETVKRSIRDGSPSQYASQLNIYNSNNANNSPERNEGDGQKGMNQTM